MNRFFFDVGGGQASRDEDGTEFASLEEVRQASVRLLGEELRERKGSFWDNPELMVTVRNDNDLILLRLTVFGTTAPAGQ
jgi:hypothetical protein